MADYRNFIKFKQFTDSDFEITRKVAVTYNSAFDRTRKDEPTIKNARIARSRARTRLADVLRCNDWSFFITLTFGSSELLDDETCRYLFEKKWRADIRLRFPAMKYLAVPEYQKSGTLHYHIVCFGVSAADLGLVDSGRVYHKGHAWKRKDFLRRGFIFDLEKGEGATIYNVKSWKFGFSTCTKVFSSTAVCHYVSKYISKANIDPRFYNKKHFYVSRNCARPVVTSSDMSIYERFNGDLEFAKSCDLIFDDLNGFQKFRVPECKEDIIRRRLGEL